MRILVVEDDPILALIAIETLEADGHEVFGPAYDAPEALDLAATEALDLAVVDINLAGEQEGIALASAFRTERGIPSVFVGGQRSAAHATKGVALGLLRKPYLPGALAAAVRIVATLRAGNTPAALPDCFELFGR